MWLDASKSDMARARRCLLDATDGAFFVSYGIDIFLFRRG